MALYVALCYYDRDQSWEDVPDPELPPSTRSSPGGPPRPGSCAAAKPCTR